MQRRVRETPLSLIDLARGGPAMSYKEPGSFPVTEAGSRASGSEFRRLGFRVICWRASVGRGLGCSCGGWVSSSWFGVVG